MKIVQPKKISKKKIVIITAIIVVGFAGVLATYVYAFGGNLFGWSANKPVTKTGTINYNKPTTEQKQAGDEVKQNAADTTKPTTGGSDQTPAPIPQASGKSKVNITITAANQNGSVLQLRSLIATTTTSGTCTLTLTSGSKTVTKTSSVQALASNSTCQGFDIPVSELSTGTWQAALHFENDTLTGDASQSIMIQ